VRRQPCLPAPLLRRPRRVCRGEERTHTDGHGPARTDDRSSCRSTIATTELYLHADVDRLGSVLIRKSPLERGRRKKVAPLRPALEQLLGELRGLVR
jgi:hypothetical protein